MGFTNNLDLEELLNYLVSGSFFLSMLSISQPAFIGDITNLLPTSSNLISNITLIVLLTSTALFLGHFFSMIVRYFIRVVQNWLLGDPEDAILPTIKQGRACSSFFSDEFRDLVKAKYQTDFGSSLEKDEMAHSIPRLIRSYVLHHSESARQIRERLIRARSFCANLSVAFMFSSIANIFTLSLTLHFALWGGALILMIKQRSLDIRESKEIYTHFLSIQPRAT